jgi:hypothetical protein
MKKISILLIACFVLISCQDQQDEIEKMMDTIEEKNAIIEGLNDELQSVNEKISEIEKAYNERTKEIEERINKEERTRYMGQNRNYAFPVVEIDFEDNKNLIYNQNYGKIIYVSNIIMKSLGDSFVNEQMLSNIVECLSNYPHEDYNGLYATITITEVFRPNIFIEFSSMSDRIIMVQVLDGNKESIELFKIKIESEGDGGVGDELKIVEGDNNESMIKEGVLDDLWKNLLYIYNENKKKKYPTGIETPETIYETTELTKKLLLDEEKEFEDFTNLEIIDIISAVIEKTYEELKYEDEMILGEFIRRLVIYEM